MLAFGISSHAPPILVVSTSPGAQGIGVGKLQLDDGAQSATPLDESSRAPVTRAIGDRVAVPFPVPPAVPPRPPHELSNDEFGKVPGVVDDREPANPFERQTGGPPRCDAGFLRERANSVTWQPIGLQSVIVTNGGRQSFVIVTLLLLVTVGK